MRTRRDRSMAAARRTARPAARRAAARRARAAATRAPPPSGQLRPAATCDPVAGDQLVVLEDDKGLQNADNVIPAVNARRRGRDPALVPLLDTVSAVLDTDELIALNKAVDVDRQTSQRGGARRSSRTTDSPPPTRTGSGKDVTIGAANFSESSTLAELYAEVLTSAGYDVRSRPSATARPTCPPWRRARSR